MGKVNLKRESWEALALDHVSVNKDLFGGQRRVERKLAKPFPSSAAVSARLGDCWIWERGKGWSQTRHI